MRKTLRLLERYFEPVAIVLLISAMTGIICAQIVLRLFGTSMPEAEEIARYLFVWAMYLSISYAIRDNRHIRITLFVNMLPPAGRLFFHNFADLVFLTYSLAVMLFGWQLIKRSLELGQIAPATEWPVAVVYSSVFFGALLCSIRLCVRLYQRLIERDSLASPATSDKRTA
ncbi:MAG: TRAP transporter small permease [Cellvibrionales bacterium]|nr:TRAP transporter small permease [Cellvibrionales bacterium]